MSDAENAGSDRSVSAEEQAFENYLPGMPRMSAEPGRFERFVGKLFRQRGTYEAVVRRVDR